jgi:NCK-associated protein 1
MFVFIDVDMALGRLLYMGVLISFKNLLSEALNEVLEKRLPYLMNSAQDISKNYTIKKGEMLVNDMMYGCGYPASVDTGLYELLRTQTTSI